MPPRRPRRPSAEDKALWERIARTTTPLPDRPSPRPGTSPIQRPASTPKEGREEADVPAFRIGEKATGTAAHRHPDRARGERLAQAPVRMDHGKHRKMLRGKMKPEGRIDLHGRTLAEAHPALTRFILDAFDSGKRLVLVITGKGKDRDEGGPIPGRRGVLRHQVPMWLQAPPLGAVVLELRPAHVRHGGEGAFYVYLKRNP